MSLSEMEITIKDLFTWISKINNRVEIINDRTKMHTIYIKNLEKQMKELIK